MFQIDLQEVKKAAGSSSKKTLRRALACFYQTLALAQTPGPDLVCQDVVQHRQFMKYYNINSVYKTSRARAGWQSLTQQR